MVGCGCGLKSWRSPAGDDVAVRGEERRVREKWIVTSKSLCKFWLL